MVSFVQLEGEATARAIRLANFVNTPLYVVHVMSIDAMHEIAKAKESGRFSTIPENSVLLVCCLSATFLVTGQRVIGEPVISGLSLDDSWLWESDFITAAK